jgi:hypothetical protein
MTICYLSQFAKFGCSRANGIEPPVRYAISESMPKALRGYTNKVRLRGLSYAPPLILNSKLLQHMFEESH